MSVKEMRKDHLLLIRVGRIDKLLMLLLVLLL
jgi:hypothetical protein